VSAGVKGNRPVEDYRAELLRQVRLGDIATGEAAACSTCQRASATCRRRLVRRQRWNSRSRNGPRPLPGVKGNRPVEDYRAELLRQVRLGDIATGEAAAACLPGLLILHGTVSLHPG
jgi:hypothetical protein